MYIPVENESELTGPKQIFFINDRFAEIGWELSKDCFPFNFDAFEQGIERLAAKIRKDKTIQSVSVVTTGGTRYVE